MAARRDNPGQVISNRQGSPLPSTPPARCLLSTLYGEFMGKGDKKTKRGKINRASYGKNRKRKPAKKAKPAARAA